MAATITVQQDRPRQEAFVAATNTEEVGIGVQIAIMVVDEVGQGRPTIEMADIGVGALEIETRTMSRIYLFHEEMQEMCRMYK